MVSIGLIESRKSANLDHFGLVKVEFFGLFETIIMAKFGLDWFCQMGTQAFFEKISTEVSPQNSMGLGPAAY